VRSESTSQSRIRPSQVPRHRIRHPFTLTITHGCFLLAQCHYDYHLSDMLSSSSARASDIRARTKLYSGRGFRRSAIRLKVCRRCCLRHLHGNGDLDEEITSRIAHYRDTSGALDLLHTRYFSPSLSPSLSPSPQTLSKSSMTSLITISRFVSPSSSPALWRPGPARASKPGTTKKALPGYDTPCHSSSEPERG
jgi:hypothetical protein